jgi:pimeloyl-ACP methyl ester carboxylesterase
MTFTETMRFSEVLAPFAQSRTLVNGLRVSYVDSAPESKATTTLLVHGLQDEADTWRHIVVPLSHSHRVVALDLPGFGRSDKPRRSYDLPFFAETVLALLDSLHIERAHLVGSSLGAMICEYIADQFPSRAHSLTLIDGTLVIHKPPPTPPGAILRMLFADYFDRKFFAELRNAPNDAYASLRPYYADLDAMPAADRDFLYQRVNERVWDERQRKAALSTRSALTPFLLRNTYRLRAAAARLTLPTTVIWGTLDAILSPVNGSARAALQPGARLVEIPEAGHLPHQERPQKVLEVLTTLST